MTSPNKPRSLTSPIPRDLIRAMCAVFLIVLAVHLLAGCGGGDPEPDVQTPQVNCALQPVLCQ